MKKENISKIIMTVLPGACCGNCEYYELIDKGRCGYNGDKHVRSLAFAPFCEKDQICKKWQPGDNISDEDYYTSQYYPEDEGYGTVFNIREIETKLDKKRM
jgi:hypothetical protein